MKQRVKEIMKELYEAHLDFRKETNEMEDIKLPYELLFSEACSCYRGEKVGNSKSKSPNKILATEKQKNFIYKNNMDVNTETLTKKEATQLIKEFLEKQK